MRYVIRTTVALGEFRWPIELTLTNRRSMHFRMLLGRASVSGLLLIDPAKSYLTGRKLSKLYSKSRKRSQGINHENWYSFAQGKLIFNCPAKRRDPAVTDAIYELKTFLKKTP